MPHNLSRNNNQKKIALFIPSLRLGGGERVMIDLANAFARRGYDIDLLVFTADGHFTNQLDPKVHIVSLRARRIIFTLPKLVRYLRRVRPPVLMALDTYNHLLALTARVVSGTDTRIVLRIGTMLSILYTQYTRLNDRMIPPLTRLLYPRADAVIAVSRGVTRDTMHTCNVPEEKITTIFNPKNREAIRAMSRESLTHKWLGDNKDRPVIIAGGRLRPGKGFEDLFEAFALLNKQVPSRLIILGAAGKMTSGNFAELVGNLGIAGDVDFAGYTDNPHAYTARADVFVMPSVREGLPNALIEALMCGTPTVSTDCDSGPREILAPGTDPFKRITEGVEWAEYGALVPVHGIAEMAEALLKLVSDPALSKQYRDASIEGSVAFDEEKIVDEYLNVLNPVSNHTPQ
jgi:glycosyltransferase involved in cell wall biosynthesis